MLQNKVSTVSLSAGTVTTSFDAEDISSQGAERLCPIDADDQPGNSKSWLLFAVTPFTIKSARLVCERFGVVSLFCKQCAFMMLQREEAQGNLTRCVRNDIDRS